MFGRKNISDVFTPRNHKVNDVMYIHRPKLEKMLIRKIEGTKHIIIYGESGCGKSWLYKKVLSDKKTAYVLITLAKAKRLGSITNIFKDEIANKVGYEKKGYTDIKNAEANAGILKGALAHRNNYIKIDRDPIREYIQLFKKENPIIVLDNLESIFNDMSLMDELGDILTLLDDANYKAKFLIVGVPSEVIQYFNSRKLLKTVANRLTELPEVTGLSHVQVEEFIKKGFVKELKIRLKESELNKISKHIFWVTNGVPQKLHEYVYLLGYKIEDNNWNFTYDMLEKVNKEWVLDSLNKNYTLIESMMNSIETKIGRKSGALLFGKINKTCFKPQEIEKLLRKEFRNSTKKKRLNINLILNDLAEWVNSFIKKDINQYIIVDNEYILCIRLMLYKTENEKVIKVEIGNMR